MGLPRAGGLSPAPWPRGTRVSWTAGGGAPFAPSLARGPQSGVRGVKADLLRTERCRRPWGIIRSTGMVVGGSKSAEITQLLRAWSGGDEVALERLAPLVYQELHRMARRYMNREAPGNTLQTTALVHEAYLRLAGSGGMDWQDRAHFYAISAQMMRRILVDAARTRRSEKRGGASPHLNFDEVPDVAPSRGPDLAALDDALNELAKMDPRKVKVIELRFFGGLSVEETAEALGISPQSVLRDWKLAKAWLTREMSKGDG